ncbi:MAG: DUF4157 domain-containing protein [Myxococcales bacterium]|nr:DUF4157 domain-containing protein [Myxococcales bacterium]
MDQLLRRDLGNLGLDSEGDRTGHLPGKSTLTSRLAPATQLTVLRLSDPAVARALGEGIAGRDANGVAAGADAAVERAAASTGAPLPVTLQRQFEQSLDADLSRVRLHTGPASREAADAVGARAYTVGQDIHFADGMYQPDDPFGLHLLAHEVAHTVQQDGAAPVRQHQLVVSSPQDAAEHEADRAADAMVRGEPTTVARSAGVSRVVAREPAPAAAPKPDGAKPAGATDDEKARRPKLEGQSISKGILPELGGSIGFTWTDGAVGTLGFTGEKKKDLWKKSYNQQIPLAAGVVGELKGELGVSVGATADATFKTALTKADGPRAAETDMLTVSAAGGGSVQAAATGSLKLGAGVGVANVLSITGGGFVSVSAVASAGITVTGSIENVEDQVTGAIDVEIGGGIDIKAAGGVYVDLNSPGDVYNIYKCNLGEATIGSLKLSGGGRVTGEGGLVLRPFALTGECSLVPPARVVETRKATPEERKKIAAQHPQEGAATGASGNRADGVPEDPQVEMSDEELWTGGMERARTIMNGHVGETVPIADPHSGGAIVQAKVGGYVLPARVAIAESEHRRLAEQGKAVDRVTSAQIAAVRSGTVYRSTIMDGSANTVDQVAGRIIGAGGFEVDLVNPTLELKDVPMAPCRK